MNLGFYSLIIGSLYSDHQIELQKIIKILLIKAPT